MDKQFFEKPEDRDGPIIKIGIAFFVALILSYAVIKSYEEWKQEQEIKAAIQAFNAAVRSAEIESQQKIRQFQIEQIQRVEAQQAQQAANLEEAIIARQQAAMQRAEMYKRQNEAVAAQAAERAQKEAAWERFYKKRPECENLSSSSAVFVECGNDHMRAKQKFEKQWQSQRHQTAGM